MEAKKYDDLVAFLSSKEEQRVWPSWINDCATGMKKKKLKKNYRALVAGTTQKAGFTVQKGKLYKRFFKNNEKEFGVPRIVVKAEDVQRMLKLVHDRAGHVGIGNTRGNCVKEGSMMIWWKGINNDIRDYNRKCPDCIKAGAIPEKSGELQSIKPPKKAFSY